MVRDNSWTWLRTFVRLLVHGLSCYPTRIGGKIFAGCAQYSPDCCNSQDADPPSHCSRCCRNVAHAHTFCRILDHGEWEAELRPDHHHAHEALSSLGSTGTRSDCP